ncbi:MAG TPA: transglycosylase domain-containing protein [Dehalococcoidia bacterium]|nr:transglycosylase domain-containing protein [Dehalococcoidia bacterium]
MARNATRRVIRERLHLGRGGNGGGRAPRWVQVFGLLAGLGVVGMAIMGIAGFGVYRAYANDIKPPDEVIAQQPSGGAQIFDRHGNLLYEYVDDRSGLRSPVKLEDISPYMIAATISTEDASFWNNPGINPKGLARAGLEYFHLRNADAASSTGGSSITQQLVKNIYISPEERAQRSLKRKLKETIYSVELTNQYSKDQILEWYLNQISYGGLYNGVEAASLGYFGKHAKDLTLPEAAMLAGIPACPSCYDPISHPDAAAARRNEVLRIMHTRDQTTVKDDAGNELQATQIQVDDDGTKVKITDAAFYLSTLAPVNIVPQRFPVQAPHFVFDVIQPELEARFGKEALYSGGLRVTTSLDLDLQQKGQEALEHWISEFEQTAQGHNGAMVAIDPRTSEVLVYIGSRDYFNQDIQGQNDNAQALNSPGSTLKPFTYATTFEQLGWGPDTELLDTPISYPDGDKVFTPRNPSGDFHGPITVRNALGNSLNIPAFKAVLYAGVNNVVAEYKKFGMTTLDNHTYGPSVTIGGVDIKLYDVTYAYTVLASGGVMRGVDRAAGSNEAGNRTLDPVTILQITRQDGSVLYPTTEDHRVKVKEDRVIDPGYAYMINNILSDPNAFCLTYGCGALSIGRPWGVKTGTSEPYENSRAIGETWTYGYTPDLVTGVWAGNSDNSPMYNITSTSISYRAVRDFMQAALADTPPSNFERPPDITDVDICEPSMLKPTPACGRVVKTIMPKDHTPKKDDDWWRTAKVDIRNGLLATELTPPQFVQERRALVVPDGLSDFAKGQASEWARILNVGVVPTEKSTGDAPVRLDSPKDNANIKGVVQITGKADSPDFVAYRLEFGAGNPPYAWTVLLRSTDRQPGGGLGLWNTADLPAGIYTLRLVVEDAQRGELSTFVTVTVGENVRHSPSPTPEPQPTEPAPDGDLPP